MLQTTVSTPTLPVPDRRAPAPPRHAPSAPLVELADADDFARLVERHAQRCRRDGDVLSALCLQVQFDSEPDGTLHQQLLAECARRLCSRVRSTDCVARWQGTHFGVLLPRCAPVHAEAVRQRLTRFAGGHYSLGEQLLNLRVLGQLFCLPARAVPATDGQAGNGLPASAAPANS